MAKDMISLRDLLTYLANSQGVTKQTKARCESMKKATRKRYTSRNVVKQVVRLFQSDAAVRSVVDQIVARSIQVRNGGEDRSADRFGRQMADECLLSLLKQKARIPAGYSFVKYPSDWSMIRNKLALLGYSSMMIYKPAIRIAEQATNRAKDILRGVQKDLQKYVA